MKSIVRLFNDRTLWFVAICIIVMFLAVPQSIFKYSWVLLIGILTCEILMLWKGLRGTSCLILAYSLTIPYSEILIGTGATTYISYVCVLVAWFVYTFVLYKRVGFNFGSLNKISTILLILSIIFFLKTDSYLEITIILYFLLSTYGVYYITLLDNLSLEQFFNILDLVFYFTFFYTIQEIIFKSSPYQIIYADQHLDYQIRAKGILGHPLVLSAFLSFYHSALLVRMMIIKQWSLLNFILLVPLLILCGSKTGILLVIVAWGTYFIINRSFKSVRFYIGVVLVAAIGALVFPAIGKYVEAPIERMVNSEANHRVGSYSVAASIFSNNLLGIGLSRDALKKEVASGSYTSLNSNYDSSFLIFDNAYLTSMSGYGLFSILLFVFFLHPIFNIKKFKHYLGYVAHRNAVIIVFIIWLLQNFSFDSIFYFPLNASYFVLIASIIKSIHSLKIQTNTH